jgi:asparagine synthase (glutamine-hydrolysing)
LVALSNKEEGVVSMCGIVGWYNFKEMKIPEERIALMADRLTHRGPDDSGTYVSNSIGFGFRRLSIIDLERGHQPMFNEDKSLCIIFNGEIYNFPELKKELGQHQFRTTSDTEVILHLFEEHGEDAFGMLNGMFALAIWDSRNQVLYCARDRYGQKPFYYYIDDDHFIFGSEVPALLGSDVIEKKINKKAVVLYYLYSYVPAPMTIYENIFKLMPGNMVTIDKKGIRTRTYAKPVGEPFRYQGEGYSEVIEKVDWIFDRAVKRHMISDVEVGLFLSGGLDSTTVLKYATNYHKNIQSFSIIYRDGNDESEYIDQASQRFPHKNKKLIVSSNVQDIQRTLRCFSEPFADGAAIGAFLLSEYARQFVKVVLTGEGGDELFMGYRRYRYMWLLSPILALSNRLRNYFYLRNVDFTKVRQIRKHMRCDLMHFEEHLREVAIDSILSVVALEQRQRLPDNHFVKIDTTTMANSLEARVPILDNELSAYLNSVPVSIKMKHGREKALVKSLLGRDFSKSFIYRRKLGFGSPVTVWMKDRKLRKMVKDVIVEQQDSMLAIWTKAYYNHILNQFDKDCDLRYHMWLHYVLCIWLQNNSISI